MRRASILVLALFFSCAASLAQQDEALSEIEARRDRLEAIEQSLRAERRERELLELREEARVLRREGEETAEPLRLQVEQLRSDLEQLGEPPGEDGPPEDEAITETRARLQQQLSRMDSALRQAELNVASAVRVSRTVDERRREAFFSALARREASPLSPDELSAASTAIAAGFIQAQVGIEEWLAPKDRRERRLAVLAIVFALLLAFGLLVPIRRRINVAITRRIATLEPLPSRRVLVAAGRTLAKVLPGLLGGLFVYEALRVNGAVSAATEPLARAVWLGFVTLLFADGAVTAVFAPRQPAWRVAPLGTRSVLIVRALILIAALVVSLDLVLRRGAELVASSPSLSLVQEGMVAIALSVLIFMLCDGRLWRRGAVAEAATDAPDRLTEGQAPPGAPETPAIPVRAEPAARIGRGWRRLRLFGRGLALTALLSAVIGFVDLGHYLTVRSLGLVALFAGIWSLRALMREGVRLIDRRFTAKAQEEAEGGEKLLYSWIGIGIDVLALAAFVPPALIILGAQPTDVSGWLADAFLGFQVGSVRISVAELLGGLLVFLGLLWLTRSVQRTMESKVFPRSRIDPGVQNSLKTLIGYVGLVVAAAVGVGMVGFDLGNLAIIAGALSVGIGFGLQSIVNNFVSGLILLFERPIKVGDWIVTSSGEGIVKRISVRSTEIETFDRSSVIVPNSELISGAVTNWTHKDKMGRLVIAVGAAYSSDAAQVVRVLEGVAQRSTDTLREPAPLVVFEDFGASSLDFTLRVYIRDVSETLRVRTRLRIAIHEAFRREGIEIPFPQHDLYLRGVPEDLATAQRGTPSQAAE